MKKLKHHDLKQNDLGQITTALVMVGTVMVFALAMVAAKLGQATDQKSQVQSAADAVALAGAQQIAKDAPELAVKSLLSDLAGQVQQDHYDCRAGQVSALDFAQRAGVQLVTYCYELPSDTVHVTVSSLTKSVSGLTAKATAEARVGVSLGECVRRSAPTSTPSAAQTPPPLTAGEPGGPPLLDGRFDVDCGDVTFPIEVVNGNAKILLPDAEIRALFEPALKPLKP
jgi:hypothetical protein